MSQVEIRQLSLEESAETIAPIAHYSLMPSPPGRKPEDFIERYAATANYTRYYGLFEDGKAASCTAAGPMTQNVRGKLVDMSGVFMVATDPLHRRKGYSYQVLSAMLKGERDAGKGFTCLYPFRESFYERLGYTSWQVPIDATLNPHGLHRLVKDGWGEGVELVDGVPNVDLYYQFMADYQKAVHGVALFQKELPLDPERNQFWLALSKVNGQVDGLMLYKITGNSPTKYKLDVSRFYYRSQQSLYQFLGWFGRHIDQTDEVILKLPPFEKPHTWHPDMGVSFKPNWIPPMGRVLDVEKLAGLPVVEGGFTARIFDSTCRWNEGVWRFEAQEDGTLAVEPAQKVDCDLAIQGLSALVYGVAHPDSFEARGWGSPSAEVSAAMLALFPPANPYIHAYF